jgi:glycosyltransferase involved in cell wall biosynthesis
MVSVSAIPRRGRWKYAYVPAPLRVHHLIASLGWGGAETLLAHLAAGASAAGLELSVGYLLERDGSPAAAALRTHGLEPQPVGVRTLVGPRDLRRVRQHVAAADADVLHTHLGYADLMGGLGARSLGLPSVATIHVMERSPGARERVKDELMAFARRRCAARVICVSEAAREWYLGTGWERRERVVVVPNGAAARPAAPGDRERVRSALGLGPADLAITMLGVLRPGKGHDVAMAAVSALRTRFPALKLLIVGDGPTRADVARLAAGLEGSVLLTGHRDDVPEVLAASDALVHPTERDAFPTALLEAMAAGLPIVATAVGGIPEIVVDGTTGLLIRPQAGAEGLADALRRLLDDPALRARLGAAGRRRFEERFTAEVWAERLRVVYEAAGARPTRRGARRP